MASLLTDQDFLEIRTVIDDVIDTFMQLPIVYKQEINTLDRFNEDRDDKRTFQDHALTALVVWEKESADAQVTLTREGAVDLSDGYVMFGYDYLLEKNLIDADGNQVFKPELDRIVIREIEYEIIGANQIGQWKDTDCLVKVHIKKQLQDG